MGAAAARHPVDDRSTTPVRRAGGAHARTPSRSAFGGRTMTYAELDARANRLARRLRARGAGPEALVGLLVERSMETVVGILGILKAGAAYLPLDPAYPDDRLAWMLEDSGARLVVTAGDAARSAAVRHRPGADGCGGLGRSRPTTSLRHPFAGSTPSPGALAYVIYTSGSTGRPKGVQVTHANVVRLLTATDAVVRLRRGRRVDALPLLRLRLLRLGDLGRAAVRRPPGRRPLRGEPRRRAAFHALLRDERVTVLNQTPSAFRQLIRADEEAAGAGSAPDLALRCVDLRRRGAGSGVAARLGGPAGGGSARGWSTCTASPRRPCTSPTA